MKKIHLEKIQEWYQQNKEDSLYGRWIPLSKIEPILQKLNDAVFAVKDIGSSVQNRPINKVSIGTGKLRVLIWTQMHGNESTGTKAVFDLFKLIQHADEFEDIVNQILATCTITVIPMLNPDGAETYTRVNANGIDLNRDAVDLEAPESKILRTVVKDVNPHYCFNLHDQRTILPLGIRKKQPSYLF